MFANQLAETMHGRCNNIGNVHMKQKHFFDIVLRSLQKGLSQGPSLGLVVDLKTREFLSGCVCEREVVAHITAAFSHSCSVCDFLRFGHSMAVRQHEEKK
jgi:hypothetical protein